MRRSSIFLGEGSVYQRENLGQTFSEIVTLLFQLRHAAFQRGLLATTITNYLLAIVFLVYFVLFIRKRMAKGKNAAAASSGE